MKKTLILAVVFSLIMQTAQAQAKQRKMLLLQIAALRTYADYAAKGYNTVKNSLSFISDVKKGEVNLHSDYFTSLVSVNPKVKNYSKVAEIIAFQINTITTYRRTFENLRQDDLFYGNELDYIERTYRRLMDSCVESLDMLLLITSSTKLEMKDDERIERIDKLYISVMEDYIFCKKFSNDLKVLALSKKKEKNDVKQLESLLGI